MWKAFIPITCFIILISGFLVLEPETSEKERFEIGHANGSGYKVLDCRDKSQSCTYTRINYTKNCNPWWPGQGLDQLNCNKTEDGVSNISLITDPANQVRGSFTSENYSLEKLRPLGKRPWDLEVISEDSYLVTERYGKVYEVRDREVEVYSHPALSSLNRTLGLALHPNFTSNREVYIYYAYNMYSKEERPYKLDYRVSKFKLGENITEEKVILEEIPASGIHSGGRLEIGPDNKLYITTGDAGEGENSQKKDSLAGKILRVNLDGSIPDSNSYSNEIYSYGHRNPQGLAWNPKTGFLYSSEHGNNRHDEINRIKSGSNYGWNIKSCSRFNQNYSRNENLVDPVKCFKNWTMAPSGMTFVDSELSPWYGDLFLAGLRGNHIRRFEIDEGSVQTEEIFYVNRDFNDEGFSRRIRDIESYEDSLYFIGAHGGVSKISP